MSEHTPGKLKMESRYSNGCEVGPWLVDDSGKLWIAELIGAPYLGFSDTIPNARRLVACWNLCDGVPTEMLEASKPLATVYTEYADLLATCESLLSIVVGEFDCGGEQECVKRYQPQVDAARAVINKSLEAIHDRPF